MLATLLQVSRKTFWRLQHRCKSHEKLSGVCNTVASPAKNFLMFATPLQVSRKTFWRLQHRCKSHEKLSSVCNTVANRKKTLWGRCTGGASTSKNVLAPRVTSVEALCWLSNSRYEGQREASIRRPMASIPFSCSSRIP